tara:strand:+ start:1995 stop:2333 length:339 start_codon:yes stop_codon:yes gene_type:complete
MSAIYATNLVINTGTTFSQTFNLSSSEDNAPFNLSGWEPSSQIRKWPGATGVTTFTATVADADNGIILLSLDVDQTSALKAGRHVYDVVITQGAQKQRVVEGSVLVREGVTR